MDTEVEKICREYSSVGEIISEKLASARAHNEERSFYVANMDDIYQKHLAWSRLLPRVKPFYAVKCNNLPEIISFLASLGTGFDCASKQEIDQVLACGVHPSNIIYANPCKTRLFIKHAKQVQVDLMTFDNELELHKIAQLHPQARLVLRIKGNDKTSRCKFNIKFGADLQACYGLLKLAKQLDLNVVGVSFHNGSDCEDKLAYHESIAACRSVFDLGEELGHRMSLLDIGGGFPGDSSAKINFDELAATITRALDSYFPPNMGVDIIAEPGRYYVASSMTLMSMVIAKRVAYDENTKQDGYMYYLNDGVYGAFNNIIFEHATPQPELLESPRNELAGPERQIRPSVMWGPTCDSVDCIKRDFMFPELQIGEWVMFRNMGAYTHCVATTFNGFERASIIIADNISSANGSFLRRTSSIESLEDICSSASATTTNSSASASSGTTGKREFRFLNAQANKSQVQADQEPSNYISHARPEHQYNQ